MFSHPWSCYRTLHIYHLHILPPIISLILHNFMTGQSSQSSTHTFYVVFMCHHLDPLVVSTLTSMKKLHGSQDPCHWCPLTKDDLFALFAWFDTGEYNDGLFLAIIPCGFHMLLHVGELTEPDQIMKQLFVKTSLHNSLKLLMDLFSFHLPYHKGDQFFQGNITMIRSIALSPWCPVTCMAWYINLWDAQFPLLPELWLTSSGDHLTYSWVISHLCSTLDEDAGSNSLQSGGTTMLSLVGVSDNMIQSMGHWASDTFWIYIWKHPVLLHALLHNDSTFTSS